MIRKDSGSLFGKLTLAAGLLVFLTGCQPMVTATPLPTLATVRVQYTPALEKETGILHACAQKEDALGLLVEKIPAQALEVNKADLSLRIGLPTDAKDFAADLGKIEIIVIAHPDQGQTHLTLAELSDFYSGKTQQWTGKDGKSTTAVQLWSYLKGDDLRQAFEGLVLGDGTLAKDLHEAPNPQAMVQAVARTPGAIGYIPREWLDPSVMAFNLDTSLTAPVLALSSHEPQGAARQLLACLQK